MKSWPNSRRCGLLAAAALALTGCVAALVNDPVNTPLSGAAIAPLVAEAFAEDRGQGVVLGLSFSGGGTRAAAFAHGVLTELAAQEIGTAQQPVRLIETVNFVSGVSGGSVAAAYFGLKGPAAVNDFRERFLLRDGEEMLRTSLINPANFVRALEGGANDSTGFPRWLDDNLFNGATFGDLASPDRPLVLINASDIFNRAPFVFGPTTFNAFCSDINAYPLSQAVAASAAVPIVFAPVVIKTYPDRCNVELPRWISDTIQSPGAPASVKAFADSLKRYRSGQMPFIKLLDGGITDNLGLHGFLVTRLGAEKPYAPLTPRDAVRIRQLTLFVVNAGRGPSGDWVQTISGPSGGELFQAVTDTAIDASVRSSLDALSLAMDDWQKQLISYRCSLPLGEVAALRGNTAAWNCKDIRVRVHEISFSDLGGDTRQRLNAIPTRFKLPAEQVDLLISAGREALRRSSAFKALNPRPVTAAVQQDTQAALSSYAAP